MTDANTDADDTADADGDIDVDIVTWSYTFRSVQSSLERSFFLV